VFSVIAVTLLGNGTLSMWLVNRLGWSPMKRVKMKKKESSVRSTASNREDVRPTNGKWQFEVTMITFWSTVENRNGPIREWRLGCEEERRETKFNQKGTKSRRENLFLRTPRHSGNRYFF